MARQRRDTEPLDTVLGTLTRYEEIEPVLSDGEARGRRWILSRTHDSTLRGTTPRDQDVLDLHEVMFAPVFAWAGATRREDRGPGGVVAVPWPGVRVALRTFTDDLAAWVAALAPNPDLGEIAAVVADAHHRFQWIHPFHDTNGRTGRVLDHYLLWVTFGLGGVDFSTTRALEYFPTLAHEDAYYDGLRAADAGVPDGLRAYYTERLIAAFGSLA